MNWKNIRDAVVGLVLGLVIATAPGVVAGLITKPYTFTPFTSARSSEVNQNFDVLYNEINGNLTDANISASANISPSKINLVGGISGTMLQDGAVTSAKIFDGSIVDADVATAAAIQQSKILSLVSDLAAKLPLVGGTMTGQLVLGYTSPSVRLGNTVNGDGDFKIQSESGTNGSLTVYENTNTYASPTWVARASVAYNGTPTVATDLTTKSYVDTAISNAGTNLGFAQTVKVDGDFTAVSGTFVDVTGLSATVTNLGTHRLRVSLRGIIENNTGNTRSPSVNIQIDGVDMIAADGVWTQTIGSNNVATCPVDIVSLGTFAAGSHTVTVQLKNSAAASVVMRANATSAAVLTVEEMVR